MGLAPAVGRRLYRLRPEYVDVKLRVDDFNVALLPESQPLILNRTSRIGGVRQPLQFWFGDAACRPMKKVLSSACHGPEVGGG